MANQPNIRFKGFTEEWVEKFFEELYTRCIEKNDLSFEADKIISVANMFYRSSVASSSDEYMRTYNIMRLGDIAYEGNKSANYAYGRWVENYIGDGIVSHVFEVLRPKSKYDLLFWKYAINNECIMRHILLRCTKKATMMTNIVVSDFLKQKIDVPSIEEQYKIGLFLQSIDSTITQREKELEKLKNIKRALLEKLFPQNGEKVPALRFKEFTEEWGEVALGSIADRVTTKNSSKAYTETFTNSAEHGIMSQSDFFDHAIANQENITGYYVVQENDFVYNPRISKLAPVGPINRNKLGRTGVVSPLYTVFRPKNVSVEYLEVFFIQNSWNKFMNFNGNSGARLDRFSISDAIFWQMPIQYPQIEEQQKTAKLITTLSNLLSLREKQLTLLKHTKQALLEQMFVNE